MILILLLDAAFLAAMLGCAVCDWKSRTIPNALIAVMMGLGIIRLLSMLLNRTEIIWQLIAIPVFILCLVCWKQGQIGGGDVKLIGVICFYMGIWDAAAAFAVSLFPLLCLSVRHRNSTRQQIAMAPPLAFGCVAVIAGQYLAAMLLN